VPSLTANLREKIAEQPHAHELLRDPSRPCSTAARRG